MRYSGGDEGARTPDLDSAIVALSQLSYVPVGETQYSTARATTQEQSSLAAQEAPLARGRWALICPRSIQVNLCYNGRRIPGQPRRGTARAPTTGRSTMPLSGSFREYPLADVLHFIEGGQRSGRLAVGRGSPMAHIYFSMGQWIAGERLGATVTLAQELDRAGIVPAAAVESALGLPFDATITMTDTQLMGALMNAGALTSEQLNAFAFQDAVAMLATMLQWTDGEFFLEEGIPVPTGILAVPLSIGAILAQAMQVARPQPTVAAPLAPEVVIDFAEINPQSDTPIQVTRDQWRLLTMVDGRAPLWVIAEALQAPEPIILQLAGELVAANIAVIAGRAGTGTLS